MEKFKDNLKMLFSRERMLNTSGSYTTIFYGCLFFVGVSTLLTIFNIVKENWFMTGTTTILILGFLFAALLTHGRKIFMARCVLALLCGIIFSVYALTGGNNGFAILWILLVPIVGMSMISLQLGFYLSLYFLLFLVVLFYTPLSHFVTGFYTATFRMRFPVLYFACFGAVTFLMCERQNLFEQVHAQAYHDALTGLYNRLYYNEIQKRADQDPSYDRVSVVSLDLNRLKYTNDNFGHEAGDEMISATARLLCAAFAEDLCFRVGGDEFTVVCKGPVQEKVVSFRNSVHDWKGEKAPFLHISLGVASKEEQPELNFEVLVRLADQRMYQEKSAYYRESGIDRRQA